MTLAGMKRAMFALGQRSGFDQAVANSAWRRSRLLILCYHGISLRDEHEWHPELYFPQALFRRRMELLMASGATVLPLDEAVALLAARALPPRSVTITFDDGMHDFSARAVPVLRELGLPSTVYLSTYHVDRQRPIFGITASYLLWSARARALSPWPEIGLRTHTQLDEPIARRRVHALLLSARDGLQVAEGEEGILESLAARLGADLAGLRAERLLHLMNDREVASVAAEGVAVEMHTHRHRSPMERDPLVREVTENRDRIVALTGRTPKHFCYPSGQYAAAQLPWLRECGVLSSVTCEPGLAGPTDDPLLLPRFVDTMLQPETTFLSWICGTPGLLPRRRVLQPHDQHRARTR